MGRGAGSTLRSCVTYIPADIEDIPIIYSQCKDLIDRYEDIANIPYDKVLQWVRCKIEKHIEQYSCAVVNGVKVGYFRLDDTGGEAELDDLYVLQGYRDNGIGTQIIEHCIRSSPKPLFLYVFSKNVDAIRLYDTMGFVVTKTVGNTRLIMRREG